MTKFQYSKCIKHHKYVA